LYISREATNLDADPVYCLVMNDLEQLKQKDVNTFELFELALFNPTSIKFEHAIENKQVNEKLNGELRRFLIHLVPFR
jgi:hypothetical protein